MSHPVWSRILERKRGESIAGCKRVQALAGEKTEKMLGESDRKWRLRDYTTRGGYVLE